RLYWHFSNAIQLSPASSLTRYVYLSSSSSRRAPRIRAVPLYALSLSTQAALSIHLPSIAYRLSVDSLGLAYPLDSSTWRRLLSVAKRLSVDSLGTVYPLGALTWRRLLACSLMCYCTCALTFCFAPSYQLLHI